MEIGERIAYLRIEKGIYQKELAAYLNVSVATISNYEKGHHAPDLTTLGKIADFFGVTTDYLLGRTSYRFDPATLRRQVTVDLTMSDVINTFLELTPKSASAAIEYARLLLATQTQPPNPPQKKRKGKGKSKPTTL